MAIQPRYLIAVLIFCSLFCHFHFLLPCHYSPAFSCVFHPYFLSSGCAAVRGAHKMRAWPRPGTPKGFGLHVKASLRLPTMLRIFLTILPIQGIQSVSLVTGLAYSKSFLGPGQVSWMPSQPIRHQCGTRHIPTQVLLYNKFIWTDNPESSDWFYNKNFLEGHLFLQL